MSKEHKKIIEIIQKFTPKDFGIKSIYYKSTKNEIEIIFIINKSSFGSLVSYLNSLPGIIENEIKNIKIDSKIYIDNKKIKENFEREKFEQIPLLRLNEVFA